MIELFWDAPYYVHIIMAIVSAIICGMTMVDDDGSVMWEIDEIGPRVIVIVAIVFLWQLLIAIALICIAFYIPFEAGVCIMKLYRTFKKNSNVGLENSSEVSNNKKV